ncbi:monovalent cation/H(+) antiporter subunit G [Isoptericola halotolerans]|uniref:monovalent cation/H(+) antiporter subunit G n=1 Tax=Isoptericola halotolerans TaxID=300560 RepID=UPI0038904812
MTEVDAGTWTTVADVAAALCLLLGAFLTFAAGVGVIRFPTLLDRMHVVTKPQVLGLLLLLLALALRVRSWSAVSMLVLVAVFQLATAPVAAHLVSRAGFRTGKVDEAVLRPNEMAGPQDAPDDADDEAGTDEADDAGPVATEHPGEPDHPGPSAPGRTLDDDPAGWPGDP